VVLPRSQGRPRILHAPSNAGIKGTPMILAALERLKTRFDFELITVENTPHAEALQVYRTADIAIDQILAGWYGGFAVEMMAMGKPVACAIREADLRFVPAAMRAELPFLRLDPATLDDDLATMLQGRASWPDAGLAARRFVERWHSPANIARAMLTAYRDPRAPFVIAPAGVADVHSAAT
jgi:glycosyltransferase involved in cell wall biosynthesis